jgi:hypothetical protein
MDDISPRKLAQSILEKHDRLIMEYSVEVDKARQINMLKEKKDQLTHWVEENSGKERYSRELAETEAELDKIRASFEEKTSSHYRDLEEKIKQHTRAKEYWNTRIGELKT